VDGPVPAASGPFPALAAAAASAAARPAASAAAPRRRPEGLAAVRRLLAFFAGPAPLAFAAPAPLA
jgi:hypothetical protein